MRYELDLKRDAYIVYAPDTYGNEREIATFAYETHAKRFIALPW